MKKKDPKGKARYSSSPASSHLMNWDKIQQTMVDLLGKGTFVVLADSESSLSSWLDVLSSCRQPFPPQTSLCACLATFFCPGFPVAALISLFLVPEKFLHYTLMLLTYY